MKITAARLKELKLLWKVKDSDLKDKILKCLSDLEYGSIKESFKPYQDAWDQWIFEAHGHHFKWQDYISAFNCKDVKEFIKVRGEK